MEVRGRHESLPAMPQKLHSRVKGIVLVKIGSCFFFFATVAQTFALRNASSALKCGLVSCWILKEIYGAEWTQQYFYIY